MAVERALRHAGGTGDIGDGDAIDAAGREEIDGGALHPAFYTRCPHEKLPL